MSYALEVIRLIITIVIAIDIFLLYKNKSKTKGKASYKFELLTRQEFVIKHLKSMGSEGANNLFNKLAEGNEVIAMLDNNFYYSIDYLNKVLRSGGNSRGGQR